MDQRVPDNIIEFVKFINKLVNIISGLTNVKNYTSIVKVVMDVVV